MSHSHRVAPNEEPLKLWLPRTREHFRRLIDKTDMRVTQQLQSGTIIRQDFRTAARFVFFDTGLQEWQYATHGGTLFVVNYRGRPYGITCRHVLKDFDWRQLVVTNARVGKQIAGITSVAYPSQPRSCSPPCSPKGDRVRQHSRTPTTDCNF